MVKITDWNIDDVVDSHQARKKRRIKSIADVVQSKGRVGYEQFLLEMQGNGIRRKVAKEYLEVLIGLGFVRVEEGEIVWNGRNQVEVSD